MEFCSITFGENGINLYFWFGEYYKGKRLFYTEDAKKLPQYLLKKYRVDEISICWTNLGNVIYFNNL